MPWQTYVTMFFAIGTIFGGLIIMLAIAFLKHNPHSEE